MAKRRQIQKPDQPEIRICKNLLSPLDIYYTN